MITGKQKFESWRWYVGRRHCQKDREGTTAQQEGRTATCRSLIITVLKLVLSLAISFKAELCSLMLYLEMKVHGKDERGEQIIRQLVAWRHREVLETDGRVGLE